MAPLVVEDHAVPLLAEPAGDGEPDLVAAAPAMGENDHRGIRAVPGQVPHSELRPVQGPDDLVVRTSDALAPAERVAPVSGSGVAPTPGGQTLVCSPSGRAGGEGRPDDQ